MPTRLARAVLTVAAAACTGSSLDAGAGDSPGSGTDTLAIDGAVWAVARRADAQLASEFDINFVVRLLLDGKLLATGTVVVTSSSGKVPLTYRDGRWIGSGRLYDAVYVLDAVSGPHRAEGVRVDGPDIHTFTQPTPGVAVSASEPLVIEWTRAREADAAQLHIGFGEVDIPDSGSYTLPAGVLRADRAVPREHTLWLVRSNRVAPAGAVAGSLWRVVIANRLDVVTEPQPPL